MRPRFKIGDHVRFRSTLLSLEGTITEDRGLLGIGGRRIYQVLVPITYSEPMIYEMREDEIELVPSSKHKIASPAK